jgi:quercetin dioxygenase-like cupin family protein
MDDTPTTTTLAPPRVLPPGGGRAHWWAPDLHRVEKASGPDTNGRFALTEVTMAAGYASPYHVHHRDDEALYVLDGEVEVVLGGEHHRCAAGAYVCMPRGVPHGYWNRSDRPLRMLILMTPPGFERFFSEHAAADGTGPAPDGATLTREAAADVLLERFGIELLPSPAGVPGPPEWS